MSTSRLHHLRDTIQTGWSLSSPVAATDIDFNVGHPEDETRRFDRRTHVIEFKYVQRFNEKRSLGRAKVNDRIYADVWIKHMPDRDAVDMAEDQMEDICDEIDDRVKAAQKTFTGFSLVVVQNSQIINGPGYLRTMITVNGVRET